MAKKKSASDSTGKQAEKQEAAKVEAQKEAEAQKKAEAEAQKAADDVVVVTDGKNAAPEGEAETVVVGDDLVRVKVLEDVESHQGGRKYNLEAGKRYDMPRGDARFLQERDYLEIIE